MREVGAGGEGLGPLRVADDGTGKDDGRGWREKGVVKGGEGSGKGTSEGADDGTGEGGGRWNG